MKRSFRPILLSTLFITTMAAGVWYFAPIHLPDPAPVETSESWHALKEAQQLEKAYRAAQHDYEKAKSRYGKDSPQSQEAATKLHAALEAYRSKKTEYDQLH